MNEEFKESLPPIIYKFRDWENPFHRKTLTHDSLYLAKQKELNDPLDVFIPFSYKKDQMTPENIKKKLFDNAQMRWPKKSPEELELIVKQRMEEDDFTSDEYWKKMIPTFNDMVNQKLGILSLTKRWDSLSLWTHYGNAHKGFCLGFNTEKLFQGIGGLIGEVIYSDEPIEVDLIDNSHHGLAKAILQKSPYFNFESEIRITKIRMAGKIILFPTDSLEKVIFGNRISEKNKAEILDVIKKFHPHTKVYISEIDPTTRNLTKNLIYKNSSI